MQEEAFSLDRLRSEAADELAVVIEIRCRRGDDPWEFLPDMPSIDEHVVLTLRADRLELPQLSMAQSRAYHPASGRAGAEKFEYQLLRAIALEHPELSTAVWAVLDRFVPPPAT